MRGGRVVVVGGGLAGLACAIRLIRAGREVALLEASDGVGGRVRTDHVAGFTLDRGFQVYLSGYARAGELLDLEGLELRRFEPGALVRVEDAFHDVGDPWRRPSGLFRTIRAPVGTLADKLRVGRLRHRLRAVPVDALFERPERTTRTELERLGFSPRMIDRFFRPFLGGVFLDPGLVTSSRMFEFVFRMFAEGDATVPAGGMERIPRQLAASLPGDVIRTGVRVVGREGTAAVTSGGTRVEGEALVVATDGSTAARLVPGLEGPAWRGVHTLYFAAEEPPIRRPILVLNGSGRGLVNNLSVLSEVAPEYAPAGASLISVSVIKADGLEGSRLVAAVREELGDWFGSQVMGWRHLQTYRIPEALPAQLPPGHGPRAVRVRDLSGVYVCGDHRWTASIEGAISSGLQAAAAVLEDLDSSPPTSS